LNLLPFGKMTNTILRPVKKSVVMVCFVPMVCCVLGITSVGDRANIFEDGQECWNQDSSPVAIPSKWLSFDPSRIRGISVDASTRATFWVGDTNGTPSAASIYSIPALSEEFP
jgi:hypothetical protein